MIEVDPEKFKPVAGGSWTLTQEMASYGSARGVCWVYRPEFLLGYVADGLFAMLWSELDWEQRAAPRREYWASTLGKPYTYGRGAGMRTYESRPSHHAIDVVRIKLEELLGFTYEGCFLNGYEDATKSIDWHADDDPGIDHDHPIAVVTVGHGRDIAFKRVGEPGVPAERLHLAPGSLLLMLPGMQQTHVHKIPKAGSVVGPRVSLTFRKLRGEA